MYVFYCSGDDIFAHRTACKQHMCDDFKYELSHKSSALSPLETSVPFATDKFREMFCSAYNCVTLRTEKLHTERKLLLLTWQNKNFFVLLPFLHKIREDINFL